MRLRGFCLKSDRVAHATRAFVTASSHFPEVRHRGGLGDSFVDVRRGDMLVCCDVHEAVLHRLVCCDDWGGDVQFRSDLHAADVQRFVCRHDRCGDVFSVIDIRQPNVHRDSGGNDWPSDL